MKVGRPSFDSVFASVNSFQAIVDYSQTHVLGYVHEADEEHSGKVILRVRRQLPAGKKAANLCCVRPWQRNMSLGNALNSAMEYGPLPATHHETGVVLKNAVPEQIQALYDMINEGKLTALSIICLATSVEGQTSELIPVLELNLGCGCPRVHLRKMDFNAPLYPAQMIALVTDH